MKILKRTSVVLLALGSLAYAYWRLAIPTHRADIRSELVMIGDLDDDHRWTAADLVRLDTALADPFRPGNDDAFRIDMNRNHRIDSEDLGILRALVAAGGDPYSAAERARAGGNPFPRPRELYRYDILLEHEVRPLWALPHSFTSGSILGWMDSIAPTSVDEAGYADQLRLEIDDEAARLDHAWRKRQARLLPFEQAYLRDKLARAKSLQASGESFEFLLALIELVEDGETLTARGQPAVSLHLLRLRDHLRGILHSPLYAGFQAGTIPVTFVLDTISAVVKTEIGMDYDLERLGPARSFDNLENFLQRAEWQYYKTSASEEDFRRLVSFAQTDLRYLRAVSRTNRVRQDPDVENHNLPMVLLFREALRIKKGDKKKAIGLLDEAIRVPYSWVKSIPREALPSSLALDNFLLPGNKEDGADKSRHWDVFGGICVYKSPADAIDLAFKREMKDLRADGFSEPAMREFIRDMIANLNGMYHVITVDPDLLVKEAAMSAQELHASRVGK